MRTLFVSISVFFSLCAGAQRSCSSSQYLDARMQAEPALAYHLQQVETGLQSTLSAQKGQDEGALSPVIRIPVVVHLLYSNAAENLPDSRIKAQIDALNRDFRRQNADSANTPARFRALAADMQIAFVLATVDPQGRATTGIVRKASPVSSWKDDDRIKFSAQGGDDAWDPQSYLNLWVGPSQQMLGYATVPGTAADRDGVVIATSVFGDALGGNFGMGRTAVHEVAHWIGLKHIWGDSYCGDDKVDDTPQQGNFTSGCPTTFRSTCSNGTLGDMYMNYMDYTYDACMNLFTAGQKGRARAFFLPGAPRNAMLSSKGLGLPWNFEPKKEAIAAPAVVEVNNLFPNPAGVFVQWQLSERWKGAGLTILSSQGTVISRSVLQDGRISVAALTPGVYFIRAEKEGEVKRVSFVKL